MQTTSWADEMKLMDGVPYLIDFFQDFSAMLRDGEPALIVDARIVRQPVEKTVNAYVLTEERQRTLEFFEQVDKYAKQERKREEKWKKKQKRDGRSKKERQRDAEYFFDHIDAWSCSK